MRNLLITVFQYLLREGFLFQVDIQEISMEMYFHQLKYLSLIKALCVKFQEGNKEERVPVLQERINLGKRTWTLYFLSTGIRNTL